MGPKHGTVLPGGGVRRKTGDAAPRHPPQSLSRLGGSVKRPHACRTADPSVSTRPGIGWWNRRKTGVGRRAGVGGRFRSVTPPHIANACPKTTPDPVDAGCQRRRSGRCNEAIRRATGWGRERGQESFSAERSYRWLVVARKRLPTPFGRWAGVGGRFRSVTPPHIANARPKTTPDPVDAGCQRRRSGRCNEAIRRATGWGRERGQESFSAEHSYRWLVVARKRLPTPSPIPCWSSAPVCYNPCFPLAWAEGPSFLDEMEIGVGRCLRIEWWFSWCC
jgi:hypothetical protein